MHQRDRRTSLGVLMWWSLRLAWSRNKAKRRVARAHIWATLEARWHHLVPDTVPGTEAGVIRAVWLGAVLASRSLVRYPVLPRRLKMRLLFLVKILGKRNGKALITAYLAWAWLWDVAMAPGALSQTLQHEG